MVAHRLANASLGMWGWRTRLCGDPSSSSSEKPLMSVNAWLTKLMRPPVSVLDTSRVPSCISTSRLVTGPLSRMAPFPLRRPPVFAHPVSGDWPISVGMYERPILLD